MMKPQISDGVFNMIHGEMEFFGKEYVIKELDYFFMNLGNNKMHIDRWHFMWLVEYKLARK